MGGAAQAVSALAVEQTHDAFDDRDRLALRFRLRAEQAGQGFRRQQPGVQVAGKPPGSRPVKGRIDVVRPDLVGVDGETAPGQSGHDGQGKGGLARAAVGAGHDQPGKVHAECPSLRKRGARKRSQHSGIFAGRGNTYPERQRK